MSDGSFVIVPKRALADEPLVQTFRSDLIAATKRQPQGFDVLPNRGSAAH